MMMNLTTLSGIQEYLSIIVYTYAEDTIRTSAYHLPEKPTGDGIIVLPESNGFSIVQSHCPIL
jgi:hypothetical protein